MLKDRLNWDDKKLVGILIFLVVVIIGLIIGIVAVAMMNGTSTGSEYNDDGSVRISEKMEGWDGEIDSSTQASMFYDEIKAKLKNNSGYDLKKAISDYENAFDEASDDLKFYLAIRYSYFVYEEQEDLDSALKIMQRVEKMKDLNDDNEVYYYNTLRTLYEKAGMEVEAAHYVQLLDDIHKKGIGSGEYVQF